MSPCLFNLYAEYIMRNAWLEEAQAGIKIAGRNINNIRYADDTTESEELKSLLMKVKQESKNVGLKLNIQKTRIMASAAIIVSSSRKQTVRSQPHGDVLRVNRMMGTGRFLNFRALPLLSCYKPVVKTDTNHGKKKKLSSL